MCNINNIITGYYSTIICVTQVKLFKIVRTADRRNMSKEKRIQGACVVLEEISVI